ncbi:esterase/lipase family protein [Actinomadura parmotrematis]|uniref:GPI inositol-deacylase PGAP1-like alpha/beta domain-containing protein n=1 Tax=Actinomadura parmotrematis TaxID=2864039 RepID=A0ABS7G2S7_9ACTN|nr:hypothetical protein [Actinomadura parmotrematis]MBW8486640.1 hypothetical protein [Actinomadura parmotrematis]
MSPRRRIFVWGVLSVVAALVVAVAMRVLGGGGAARAVPDEAGPVLLVPGYGGAADGLEVLAARLRAAGRTASVVTPPGDGTGPLEEQAGALDRAAEAALRGGAPSVDVVAHSAGGIVARLWVRGGGDRKARRVVTLGTPHHGADLAAAGLALAPGACPQACQELTPGSPLLRRLGDRVAGPVRWTSVWSEHDETVPPASSRIAGAAAVDLQRICGDDRTGHADLPYDPLVAGVVLRALGSADLPAPGPGDCLALRQVSS